MSYNQAIINQAGANTANIQPQAGSPNNAVQQVGFLTLTLTANESFKLPGLIRWYEVYLAVNDTISIRPYQNGGVELSPKGITITLDVPTNELYILNTGTEDETFSLIFGGGATPARDQRLIPVEGASLVVEFPSPQPVIIDNAISAPIPVAQVNPVGADGAFGSPAGVAPGIVIPAVAGKKIVLRTAGIQVSGPATVQLITTTGQQILLCADEGSGSVNLPFPVETAIGDSVTYQETTGSGAAVLVWGSWSYV